MPGRVVGTGAVDVSFAMLFADTRAFRPGDKVDVLVRPEHVQPDPPEATINRLGGRRTEVRYFGATCRYDFVPDSAQQPLLCEGRQLAEHAIAIAPEHLRVLAA
jgi:putative spermidine/putrescine transport system ATP-binding protein